MRPCSFSVPTMRSVSSENCSRNSRGRLESGRIAFGPVADAGMPGSKGERSSDAG